MKEILLSLSVGLTLGLIILSISAISPVKIPIPAPPVFCWCCWYNWIMACSTSLDSHIEVHILGGIK